jgi:hypothetical protein
MKVMPSFTDFGASAFLLGARHDLQTGSLARVLLAFLLTLLLLVEGGCSREIGVNFEPSLAEGLVPGTSTLPDAVQLLGKPLRTRQTLRGITVAEWWYLKDRPQGTESANLVMLFRADGKLLSIVRRYEHRPSFRAKLCCPSREHLAPE